MEFGSNYHLYCSSAQHQWSTESFQQETKEQNEEPRKRQQHYIQSITRLLQQGPEGALSTNVSGCVWVIAKARAWLLKGGLLFLVCPWDKFNTIDVILITVFPDIPCAVHHMLRALRKNYEEEIFLQFRCFIKRYKPVWFYAAGGRLGWFVFQVCVCDIIPVTVYWTKGAVCEDHICLRFLWWDFNGCRC